MKKKLLLHARAFRIALVVLLFSAIGTTNRIFAQDNPEGAINGLFTINAEGGKVYFSQGNLQYQASTDTWRFAENQYDFVGQLNTYISDSCQYWIDLFGWGTSGHNHGAIYYQPWSTSQVGMHYKAYGSDTANLEDMTGEADWGCNPISNGGNEPNLWRTLTKDEWAYILDTRFTISGLRYAKATVNDVKGVILLPNNWSAAIYPLNGANDFHTNYNSNMISEEDWSILEAAGVVFLPSAGNRTGQSVNAHFYSQPNTTTGKGRYWSSTCYAADDAYFLSVSNATLLSNAIQDRSVGQSVRLVLATETVTYNIEAEPNPEMGGTVQGSGVYDSGVICTLNATANDGYTFINWTLNGEEVSTSEIYSFTVSADVTLVANFELNSYQINATAEPAMGGAVEGMGTFNHFETCTLTATANEGYSFINWTLDGEEVSTSAIYSFTVTTDAAFVAHFGLSSYQINATAEPAMGGVVEGMGTFNHFETCTLTATANEGYDFVGWMKNGQKVSSNPTYTFTVTEAAELTALFTLRSYEITVMSNLTIAGEVDGGGTYFHGDTVTLTAYPNLGYEFVNWTKDGEVVSTKETYTFTATESATYIGNFERITYTISARANPSAGGVVTGGGVYEYGAEYTLTATANEGYTFVKWSKNGVMISTEPTLTFNATESAFYVANFSYDMGIVQTNEFAQGWNWWSCYVVADGEYLIDQLRTGLGNSGITIKSPEGYTSYLPDYDVWYGTDYYTVKNELSYKIKTAADCEVDITGDPVNTSDYPISMSYGWNWIGYPCHVAMDITTALSGFTPHSGDQIKAPNYYANFIEYAGVSFWYGSLDTIRPGMGLMYNSKNENSITFLYPEAQRSATATKFVPESTYWQPNLHAYPDNMTITAVVELDGEELNADHYEVAAFANGECRGTAKLVYMELVDRYFAFLTIHGEDIVDLSFGLYDSRTDEEIYDTDNFLVYSTNANVGNLTEPYVIGFRGLTGIDEYDNHLQVFPNPTNRGEALNINLPADDLGKTRVEFINAVGMVVDRVDAPSVQTIAAPTVAGIYTLRITVEGKGSYIRKLVVR